MPVNKVNYGNQTIIDLTDSTLSDASQLVSGIIAYDRSGTKITGTYEGSEWTSGIYMDEDGYIHVSPLAGAGGVVFEDGYLIFSPNAGDVLTLQTKTVTPTTSEQSVTPDTGYDGLSSVTVNAMPSGSMGTPTATKGSVSNHSVSVTPSVTNTAGYISGGTVNGTAVTVSASELVSGSETKTANGTYDVTNLAGVVVDVPSVFEITVTYNSATQNWEPNKTFAEIQTAYNNGENLIVNGVDSDGERLETSCGYSTTNSLFYYDVVWVDYDNDLVYWDFYNFNNNGVTRTWRGSYNPPATLQSKTVSPSESQQTVTADNGYDGLSSVTVNAVSSTYVGSGITRRSSTDLTASGTTVTVPAGYYESQASKAVASGSAATPATTITANPSISVNSSGLITATASATQNITPTVSAGYVSSGTAGTVTVSGSNTQQLSTQAAATYYPSVTDQTITSGKYLTGAQTIKAVTATNLTAANIKKDVVVQIGDSSDPDRVMSVTGTYEGEGGGSVDYNITVSSSTPSGGNNGDVWIHQTNLTKTLVPSNYTGLTSMTVSTSYPAANSYDDTSSTTYTQWTLNQSTTGYVYYTFDTSSIPDGATIVSVTSKAKVRVSNTGRVTNTTCQLYANTTAKGDNVTFASTSTSNVVTLSTGSSWTSSELDNLRMRIGGTGSTSSSTKAIYFYGGEVTVTYVGTEIYKKVSGSWVKQTDMTTLFEANKTYKRIS